MRISKWRGSLPVAAALVLRVAAGNTVNFTSGFEGSFSNGKAEWYFDETDSRTFAWKSSGGVTVDLVTLFLGDGSSASDRKIASAPRDNSAKALSQAGDRGQETAIVNPTASATLTSASPAGSGSSAEGRIVPDSQGTGVKLSVKSGPDGGNVTIDNIPALSGQDFTLGLPLYFEARWSNCASYSRRFTFVNAESKAMAALFSDSTPAKPDTPCPAETTTAAGQPSTVPSIGSVGNSAQSSGDGLSAGAVIGIAVACGVVGLALVFGLVWFLLRRRRQNKAVPPADASYGSGNRAGELMAEKEAGADVDVSPHSPYSDDAGPAGGANGAYQDGAAQADGVAAGAAAAAHRPHQQDAPRSFTPYSNRRSGSGNAAGTPSIRAASVAQTDEARVSVPSTTPGRAAPRALTTPYAHLVEEGMTEEEIRRLEEEERQLDAAIEQAGRR